MALRQYPAAYDYFARALDMTVEFLGANVSGRDAIMLTLQHFLVATLRFNMGLICTDPSEAEEHMAKARDIYAATRGMGHMTTMDAYFQVWF
jgi:hypothetical protein